MTTATVTKSTIDYQSQVILHFVKEETVPIFAGEQKRVSLNFMNAGLDAQGKSMPALTKEYAAFKRRLGLPSRRNMLLFGDLRNSLKLRGKILGFDEATQEKKIEGNMRHAVFFGIHTTVIRYGEQETVKQFNALR